MKIISLIAGLFLLASPSFANFILIPADLPDLPTAYGETVSAQIIGKKPSYPTTHTVSDCAITGWAASSLHRTYYARTAVVANANSNNGTKMVSVYVSEADVDNGQRFVRVQKLSSELCTQTLSDGSVETFQVAFGEPKGGPQDAYIMAKVDASNNCYTNNGQGQSGGGCDNKYKVFERDALQDTPGNRSSALVIGHCGAEATGGDVCGAANATFTTNCAKPGFESGTSCRDQLEHACAATCGGGS